MSTFRVRDTGALNVLKDLRFTITGGIHAEEGSAQHGDGPLSVVQVAGLQEFGGGNIPSRPWLRGWADNAPARKVVRNIKQALQFMVRTQNFAPGPVQDVTQAVLTSLATQFLAGKLRPNAPSTLAHKAPEKRALIETKQLVEALRARLTANRAGWAFEAESPTVTGPRFRMRKFGPRRPPMFGPKKPPMYGPKRPRWLLAKSP